MRAARDCRSASARRAASVGGGRNGAQRRRSGGRNPGAQGRIRRAHPRARGAARRCPGAARRCPCARAGDAAEGHDHGQRLQPRDRRRARRARHELFRGRVGNPRLPGRPSRRAQRGGPEPRTHRSHPVEQCRRQIPGRVHPRPRVASRRSDRTRCRGSLDRHAARRRSARRAADQGGARLVDARLSERIPRARRRFRRPAAALPGLSRQSLERRRRGVFLGAAHRPLRRDRRRDLPRLRHAVRRVGGRFRREVGLCPHRRRYRLELGMADRRVRARRQVAQPRRRRPRSRPRRGRARRHA